MTIERMVHGLDELVDTVRARYGKDRVVLLGHSWGTILGNSYANRHPGCAAQSRLSSHNPFGLTRFEGHTSSIVSAFQSVPAFIT